MKQFGSMYSYPKPSHTNIADYSHQLSHAYSSPNLLIKNPTPNPEIVMLSTQHNLQLSKLHFEIQKILKEKENIQQQLHRSKQENFNLRQIKRKLQQELQRMQFELDRMNQYEKLEIRENQIKCGQLVRQNQKLNKRIEDLLEELGRTKQQYRSLSTQFNILENSYKKLEQFQSQNSNSNIKPVVNETHKSIQKRQNTVSFVNNYQKSEVKNEQVKSQVNKVQLKPILKQQCKQDDINEFIESVNENGKLYQQFYQQQLQNEEQNYKQEEIMLKTFQKKQLQQQLRSLRVGIIVQLVNKYYLPSITNSKKKHSNCLKQFNALIIKDIKTLTKMANNYLQARNTILKQCKNTQFKQLQTKQQPPKTKIGQAYTIAKRQLRKIANPTQQTFLLALFRYLTIYQQTKIKDAFSQQVEHSAIKTLYKISQLQKKQK